LFGHDLFGKPLRTFPDHASQSDWIRGCRRGHAFPTLGMAPRPIEVLRMKRIFSATIGVVALTGVAHAAGQAPVAVVEDVQGKVTGAELMDYVVPGPVIKLGAGAKIIIGYMKSCWRETISGIGTVIVGTEESSVHLAGFKAGKVPCD